MSNDKKEGNALGQIFVAVAVALLAGGTAPWWWDKIFSDSSKPVISQPTTDIALPNPTSDSSPGISVSPSAPQLSPSLEDTSSEEITNQSPPKSNASQPPVPIVSPLESNENENTDQNKHASSKPEECLINGCYWQGNWSSEWAASSGSRFSGMLQLNSEESGITGTYNNGLLEGVYVNSDFSKVQGTWTRTNGNSGGSCQFGNFEFNLSDNGSTITGWWDYCGSGERWRWTANKTSQ